MEGMVRKMSNEIFSKHFAELLAGGFDACEHVENGQRYVEVRKIPIENPPWNDAKSDILIAVPNNYNIGGLDAFYMEERIIFADGQVHPRTKPIHQILGRTWRLVSWHYKENKPWAQEDNLITHIQHCRQFFKQGSKSD